MHDRTNFRKRKTLNFQEHYEYMEKVVPELIAAEQKVDEIKNSAEWKRHYGYFQTLYNRGQLKERPMKCNGYKIELGNSYVSLGDIEDLLTPDIIINKKRLLRFVLWLSRT